MSKVETGPVIGFSTGCFIGQSLEGALQRCSHLREITGARAIEVGVYPDMRDAGYPSTPWPWNESPIWKSIEIYLDKFDVSGAHFSLSDFNLISGNPRIRKDSIDLIVESIKRCASIGFHYGVLHIRGERYGVPREDQRQLIVDALQTIMSGADAAGFTLCLENAILNSRSIVMLDDLFSVVEAVQFDRVKLLVDIGHANLPWTDDSGEAKSVFGKCGDLAGFLSEASPAIFGFHIHANHGASDEHLPISNTPFILNPLGHFTITGRGVIYILESVYQHDLDLAVKDYQFLEGILNNTIE